MTPTVDDVLQERLPSWKTLDFNERDHRHRGFFLRRRMEMIVAIPGNEWMLDESLQTTLVNRLEREYAQVQALVTTTIDSLDPADASLPRHLDLMVYANPRVDSKLSVLLDKLYTRSHRRSRLIGGIAWRAAAIHDELWDVTSDQASSTLYARALAEIIDRRLRMVERLAYQLCDPKDMVDGNRWKFTGGGATGPWNDGFLVRAIELPEIPEQVVGQVVDFVGGPSTIGGPFTPPFPLSTVVWRWSTNSRTLLYNLSPAKLGEDVRDSWLPDPAHDEILEFVSPAEIENLPNLSEVVDGLFRAEGDWYARSWLPAPHAICALHLEAVLFARRRRLGVAQADAELDAFATSNSRGFIALGDIFSFWMDQKPRLMAGGTPLDWYFENRLVSFRDFQIGDHFFISGSTFRNILTDPLESQFNTVLIDVDSDPRYGGVDLRTLKLQRPGSSRLRYENFLSLMGLELNETLEEMRRYADLNSAQTSLDWVNVKDFLVQWSPYETFRDPGAWWIRIDLSALGVASDDEAIMAVPGAVAIDPLAGPGYNPPPVVGAGGSVYFPLYVPWCENEWYGYLGRRRLDPDLSVPSLLPSRVDGRHVTEFFFFDRSDQDSIGVLRPRVISVP